MKKNREEYQKEFLEIVQIMARDKNLLGDFLKQILTPREMENISVRWQIVKHLAKGEHHQAIAEKMHLGVATVTRGSRELRNKNGAFWKALKISKVFHS